MPIATKRQAARERFAALLARPDSQLDVAETALWIEAEGDPSCDVAAALGRLAALAERAAPHLDPMDDAGTRAAHLVRFLYDDAGLRGNDADYYDPRNSYLSAVLARGLGIPITLSIVYVDVARRLGLDAAGVGFPGHFLARVAGPHEVAIVDAFHGRLLERSDLRALLARAAGPAAALHPALLAPTPPREILARVLRNLKHAHTQRGEIESALACSERLLLIAPDDAEERRDVAALRELLRRVN
ncbi:MAG: transglutaminase-like domain-containing protein [Myxococcota bacterium]|nr:transglutaminase-like domain-containing protein [Myxococcota bacterium]